MPNHKTIVIVGAGPSGCSAAHFLGKAGIPHILLDKSVFPRPKVCGDGLAPRSCLMLERMQPGILKTLKNDTKFMPVWGGRLYSPAGHRAELYLKIPGPDAIPNAFAIPRRTFDHFLNQQINPAFTMVRHGVAVKKIERKDGAFCLTLETDGVESTLDADILIGCDGDRSIVKKTLAPSKLDPDHYVAGIRTYFTNVKGGHADHFFEFFFLKELLPGYLWIFPLADGRVNVGLGMLSADVSQKKANLNAIFQKILQEHPLLKDRFADAVQEGKPEGWGLALGSKMGTLSGDGFLLTGDAAALINPLTGEGVGNALYSGWLAAEATAEAVRQNRTDAVFFKEKYNKRVFRTIKPELVFNEFWSRIFKYPKMTDYVFKRIGQNSDVQYFINTLYDTETFKKQRFNPLFYLRFLKGLIF